jgi:hypothetical protein
MKSILLTTAVFLYTAVSFAQTNNNAKNTHGAKVSSTTKSTTSADTKGAEVSSVASSKSQAELHRTSGASNEHKTQTEARDANNKNTHGTTVSSTTKSVTDADAKGAEISGIASSKSQAEFHRKNGQSKEIRDENKENAKELRAIAKADAEATKDELKALKESSKADVKATHDDDALINVKANQRKEVRAGEAKNRTKVKTGAKAGANVGVGRTGVKTNAGTGLKLGL